MFVKVKCKKNVKNEFFDDNRVAFQAGKTYFAVQYLDRLVARNEQGYDTTIASNSKGKWNQDRWFDDHFKLFL